MPVTDGYTEATLADYLVVALGDFASVLTWTAAHAQIVQAVADTERLLRVSNVASATSGDAVEKLGAVAVLRRAVTSLGARYTVAEDQQTHNRSDLQKQAKEALALAERAAAAYLPEYSIAVDTLTYIHDPYQYIAEEDRVLP